MIDANLPDFKDTADQRIVDCALRQYEPRVRFVPVGQRYEITIPAHHGYKGVSETFVGRPNGSLLELLADITETLLGRGQRAQESAA